MFLSKGMEFSARKKNSSRNYISTRYVNVKKKLYINANEIKLFLYVIKSGAISNP